MAGLALIVRYQWLAFWRGFIRTRRRAQFYFTVLAVLGWASVAVLPGRLSQAAHDLTAGQTTSMESVLWTFCALWLFVLVEDESVSLTSRHLRTFPIGIGGLLAVRILSVFCSPVALLVALGSLISLWPFLVAPQTVLGSSAALLLFASAFGFATSTSHLLRVPEFRRRLLAPVALISIALGIVLFVRGLQSLEYLRVLLRITPPHLVAAVSVAATPSATIVPLTALCAFSAAVGYLLFWSFRRSVFAQSGTRAMGRAVDSVLWFPGRLGALVREELHCFRTLLDFWPGLLLVLAVSLASLFGPVPALIRQASIVMVFLLNTNVMMNGFGLNTSAELTRYAILPLRGRDVLLAKNLGVAVIVAAQLMWLIPIAVWRSGLFEAGVEVLVSAILLVSHLAWGNVVSVTAPFKMELYQFSSGGAPLTALIGATIGSTPGVAVLVLLYSDSSFPIAAIAAVLVLSLAVYAVSLHYSGRSFEYQRHIIAEQLS